ncbi:tetratricopeptide repeat protein [Brachyspira aalborgi]|uniref:tetratricopeptide repeat protein n=1 Tax=Brachyspira aalborgi TaxID=29522 RepID=UPI0003A6F6E0|nr:tetratricopeptide repeat protein [Brachyspira aalborgi]
MDSKLTMPFENELTNEEITSIDEYVERTYEEHKNNHKELTRLGMQASAAVAAGKARAAELANQSFLKNLLGNITGKNRKLRGEIDRDFAISQEASIKMIAKLAQQGKLTFDAIMGVNVKLNSLSNQIDKEFNEIYSQINKMMTMAMSSLIRESQRIDKLERSMNVVHLESTIEYLEFGGTLYKDLSDNEKILCIISDFFLATKGNYSINDIMMLKPMMDKIGVNPKDKISMLSLYETLNSNDKIANKLFEALDKAKLKELDDIYIPLLGNLQKIESLKNEEKYIVDSVVEISKSPEQDVQFSLLKSYANNNLNMDLEKENSYFDLSVAIINELSNIDNVEIAETEEINIKKIPASAQNYYDNAIELIGEEDFKGALFLLKKALENGMDNSEIYESLAKASLSLGEFDELPNYYKLAIERGNATYQNYYRFGISSFIKLFVEKQKENNYEEVIKALEKAIELSDKSVYIYINLGVIYRMLEDYDKAVEYYDKAIKLEKDNALAYFNKADALGKRDGNKNRFLIEECLNKAIAFDPRYEGQTKYSWGEYFNDLSKLECDFDTNSEDKFELEMLKRLNSFI